ncbi:MAG TPA: FCD domain-containing protein [Solirubrobacteraceae bacterium]|nr:FCD domain-containing protein [Solirubrobacteraceae bacterium]
MGAFDTGTPGTQPRLRGQLATSAHGSDAVTSGGGGEAATLDAPLTVTPQLESPVGLDAVFAPVHSLTAFEETVDRLGTAIKLGLLPPGTRLPAERELCTRLGIARSTLRQALVALGQSGHLHATRGRGGGTFVADPQPPPPPLPSSVLASWRDTCDRRMTVEVGIAVLAARRADAEAISVLEELLEAISGLQDDFDAYRQADIRFHVGLAETTQNPSLVTAMTEVQGSVTGLIALIPHPPEVLTSSNQQHRRLLRALKKGDQAAAGAAMVDHLQGTEHILAGLLPRI